jgi:hypothetical protein
MKEMVSLCRDPQFDSRSVPEWNVFKSKLEKLPKLTASAPVFNNPDVHFHWIPLVDVLAKILAD